MVSFDALVNNTVTVTVMWRMQGKQWNTKTLVMDGDEEFDF